LTFCKGKKKGGITSTLKLWNEEGDGRHVSPCDEGKNISQISTNRPQTQGKRNWWASAEEGAAYTGSQGKILGLGMVNLGKKDKTRGTVRSRGV